VAQYLLRVELRVEGDAGIFAIHPNDTATGAQLIAPKLYRSSLEGQLVAFDQRAFRREIAQLHRKRRTGMLQLSRKEDLGTTRTTVLATDAIFHLGRDKRVR